MTTNITPIEALENIKLSLQLCDYEAGWKKPEFNHKYLHKILDIATQALAPQEPQGCDNCTLNNICNSKSRCEKIKEMGTKIQNQGITIADLEICKDQRDKLMQQLHSQEKTFTVEEVRKITQSVYYNYGFMGKVMVNSYINVLLAEFKKAVDR